MFRHDKKFTCFGSIPYAYVLVLFTVNMPLLESVLSMREQGVLVEDPSGLRGP